MKPDIKVCVLCLHGNNEKSERDKSYHAIAEFRDKFIGVTSFISYQDNHGFPVFCFTMFVSGAYMQDTFLNAWEALCEKYGIASATSYEQIFNFDDIIHDNYKLDTE